MEDVYSSTETSIVTSNPNLGIQEAEISKVILFHLVTILQWTVIEFDEWERSLNYIPPVQILNHRFMRI